MHVHIHAHEHVTYLLCCRVKVHLRPKLLSKAVSYRRVLDRALHGSFTPPSPFVKADELLVVAVECSQEREVLLSLVQLWVGHEWNVQEPLNGIQ